MKPPRLTPWVHEKPKLPACDGPPPAHGVFSRSSCVSLASRMLGVPDRLMLLVDSRFGKVHDMWAAIHSCCRPAGHDKPSPRFPAAAIWRRTCQGHSAMIQQR
jgi:hypothetical protein